MASLIGRLGQRLHGPIARRHHLTRWRHYSDRVKTKLLPHERFARRHIGPSATETAEMLSVCGVKSMEELISKTIPDDIRQDSSDYFQPLSENELASKVKDIANMNKIYRSYLGQGFYGCIVPPVIKRNILENPGWITQYTPYQAELAQGRLESLMNYQTMVVDLTGLDVSNASLLDEATAAAEAMALCYRSFKGKRNKFFVDRNIHSHSLAVLQTRASFLNIQVIVGDYNDIKFDSNEYCGAMVQYPDSDGFVKDYSQFMQEATKHKVPVAMATDLLALTLLRSPGELGASIAFGNSQRFGVPMGCGGPHAAFFAVKDELKKQMPGRLVGKSWDHNGVPTYRLALQTREQFIRKGKATSNICTAQALLANMSAMYAIYHGPDGLKDIAERVHKATLLLAESLRNEGLTVAKGTIFDTLKISCDNDAVRTQIINREKEKKINIRHNEDGSFGVSMDETVTSGDLCDLLYVFSGCQETKAMSLLESVADKETSSSINGSQFQRNTPFLEHPVFNSYHSETKILRYMKQLENLDLSLCHSMIPLGSCTMKLNPTSALLPVSLPEFNSLHPFVPSDQTEGYQLLLDELETHLCRITGYDSFSFQPNSGAQGEYAGLCTILNYLRDNGETQRDVCLVPTSAHGTNPASAAMVGLKIVDVPMNKDGEVPLEAFREKIEEVGKRLAAIMITYPSTSGVFDDTIREVCDMVHFYGGQVYVDGANLNAQVGLCRPGDYGGDVSHLNLHKTFCIPHGGGGPGMGPIGVKSHLAPYLPKHPVNGPRPEKGFGTVSGAAWGSASIIPISWAYILMMGSKGLKKASEIAILNANYMAACLKDDYKILFRGSQGYNAHEFILDTRGFKDSSGIDATDIAKRMQDYGFHAPTVSWPVGNTLMMEPTESEGKAELDRYCSALISIRKEIAEIEEGKYSTTDNVLKNSPHPMYQVTATKWPYSYSREKAAFPISWLTPSNKTWPGSGRANDIHGDRHLVPTHNHSLKPLVTPPIATPTS